MREPRRPFVRIDVVKALELAHALGAQAAVPAPWFLAADAHFVVADGAQLELTVLSDGDLYAWTEHDGRCEWVETS